MDPQLKKGFLDAIVLATLKSEDSYGYKIIQDVSNIIEISESTLYPILRRLESQGLLETYNMEYMSRIRKYYKITDDGIMYLSKSREDFLEIQKIYEYILK